jgi:Reverse transcriptase (RNA-dependent DNA polymerase)/Endonuclease-reverse transcriptase
MMSLNIISWNAHSLRNKRTELSILINQLSIDIILISETWLTEECVFYIPGFSCYRADRFRGGVAIFIRSSIPHFAFNKLQLDFAESCTISLQLDNSVLKISSIYCSPSATRTQSKAFFDKMLCQTGPCLIAGDFNCKHMQWNNYANDRKGTDLYNILEHRNFSILKPDEPTLYPYIGEPSCVDFVVVKNFSPVSRIEVLNNLSSDHLPISFSINGFSSASDSHYPLNLLKINWMKFRRLIEDKLNSLSSSNLSSPAIVDAKLDTVTTVISATLSSLAPKKKPFLLRYKYSDSVSLLVRNRNQFRNLFKRTRDPSFKSSMNLLNRMIRHQIKVENAQAFEDKLSSITYADNSLYRFAKSLKRKTRAVPPLKDNLGSHFSDKEKSEALARSFKKSFSVVQNTSSKFDREVSRSVESLSSHSQLQVELVTHGEVKSIFKSLNPRKAIGDDGIPNMALIVLSDSQQFVSLCSELFNACLKFSHFPDKWKIAKVLPIPKGGQNCDSPDNFRPISLLSCLGKCFEKIILHRLNDFEFEKQIFINQQCGFRSQHSTVHQIIRITEEISFGFNKNKSTGIALLDLRKAFDSVWHDGLIHKLVKGDYPIYLTKIIHSYLSRRIAYVSFQSSNSSTFVVTSGVPQGSLIAPHLFNLYINDIPIPQKGHLSLFADDTAYYTQVPWKNLKSVKSELIKNVSSLQEYFSDWKIQLNDSKTEFSIFTKSSKMVKKMANDTISFNNEFFTWKDSVKYLGVILDKKLIYSHHIDTSIQKASSICFGSFYCLLRRKSPVSIDSKLRIYKSYIRPVLTYACPAFSNAAKCHLNKLQLFQNKILRMILNVKWTDFRTTNDIHDDCKIPLIKDFIANTTDKFYSKTVHHPNSMFTSLGQYSSDSLGFRAKHKLPRAFH